MFESLAASTNSAAQKLRVRSALNPMLWLTGIATPVCLFSAYLFLPYDPTVAKWLLAGALAPIGATVLGFAYFAVAKPDKLQSEDYQLRHESLQIIQSRGAQISIDPASITAIANPSLPLPPKGDG